MTELVTDEEGKLIYNSDALSIDLYQPLFYLIAPIAFLLFLWQISPSSSYLGHFASRFFDIDQFDSLDYGSTGGGGGYGLSSGLHFFYYPQNTAGREHLEISPQVTEVLMQGCARGWKP